jgi:AraC family transcriptional regulator
MEPRIDTISEKKLLGKRMSMSLSNNKTRELWQSFMSRRKEIKNAIGTDLYSMQILDSSYFSNFNPAKEFEKWAVTEVGDFDNVPVGMETFILPTGLYAVFLHKGPASAGPKTFQYIFATWLPKSEYTLDNRPHFEILGEKYKNEDPDSEEEIWIPVKLKSAL